MKHRHTWTFDLTPFSEGICLLSWLCCDMLTRVCSECGAKKQWWAGAWRRVK